MRISLKKNIYILEIMRQLIGAENEEKRREVLYKRHIEENETNKNKLL